MTNYCSHGTLIHVGQQGCHLFVCYYHQDLYQQRLHPDLRPKLRRHHRIPPTRRSLMCFEFFVKIQRTLAQDLLPTTKFQYNA